MWVDMWISIWISGGKPVIPLGIAVYNTNRGDLLHFKGYCIFTCKSLAHDLGVWGRVISTEL